MPTITNSQIYNEFKQLRKMVQGNGNPEESILWQAKETKNKVDAIDLKLEKHIKCGGKDKKILGMDAPLRDAVIKNVIRIVNFTTAAALIYLASWPTSNGVELKSLMESMTK